MNDEARRLARPESSSLNVPGEPIATALLRTKRRPVYAASKLDTAPTEFAVASALGERAGLPRMLPEHVDGALAP